MPIELGHYALILAGLWAFVGSGIGFLGFALKDKAKMHCTLYIAPLQFLLLLIAFFCLMWAHIVSDFSVAQVVSSSHSLKPLLYKISGVWGSHEGSMLLWILILSLFATGVSFFPPTMDLERRATTLATQFTLSASFILFLLMTSNPFVRLFPPPLEGHDLNPLLQDPGLAFHPPFLYVGYVGLSISFSFALSALLDGKVDRDWARLVRFWTLLSWIFLTLGITGGSFWAYYTLGWGGFWFWDPVENASLMPWLSATALFHCLRVLEKRDTFHLWSLFLALVAFGFSLLGTFLVRSGLLTSVHAFAQDPQRGLFILVLLSGFIGGSFLLLAWRAPLFTRVLPLAPLSREGALMMNNLLLTTSGATLFVGTLYPLLLESLTGEKISVGAPFFITCLTPLIVMTSFLMPFAQNLSWIKGDVLGAAQRVTIACIAGVLGAFLFAWRQGASPLGVLIFGMGLYVLLGAFTPLFAFGFRQSGSLFQKIQQALKASLTLWGTAFAHAGVGLLLLSLSFVSQAQEAHLVLPLHQPISFGSWSLTFEGITKKNGPNFIEKEATIALTQNQSSLIYAYPSERFFPTRKSTKNESSLTRMGLSHLALTLVQIGDNDVSVRAYWKPWILLLWISGGIMAWGGLLTLFDLLRKLTRSYLS